MLKNLMTFIQLYIVRTNVQWFDKKSTAEYLLETMIIIIYKVV